MWSLIALIHLHYIEKSGQDLTEERSPNINVNYPFNMHINKCISACMRIQNHMLYSLIVTLQLSHTHYHFTAEMQAYVPSPRRHAGCLCVCFHFIHVTVWLNHHLLYLFLSFLLQLQNKDELFIFVENDLTKIVISQKKFLHWIHQSPQPKLHYCPRKIM